MLFNSYIYILLFLPFVAVIYFYAGMHQYRKLSVTWLVITSLFFYAWWNPMFLPLMIGSVLFNFYAGAAIRRGKSNNALYTQLLLFSGIAVNLVLLCYFKYFNFFIDNINILFKSDIYVAPIVLPLAISFFTFQQIMYLVDAYSRDTEDYNLTHYALFVTFFPQLIAGPIVHHGEMMPQFDSAETYRPRWDNIEIGLSIFAIGLFKKVILADNIADFSDPVFLAADKGQSLPALVAWQGAVAFGLQVYFDFSAYSDMAIGSALLFGIKLPINFYSPYKSQNIAELWRHWHITLTRLITAYIYTPMSITSARKGLVRNSSRQAVFWKSVAAPSMVTFLLVGVWHGAGWNFAIFGMLQGMMVIVNNLWRQFRKDVLNQDLKRTTLPGRILSRGLTLASFIFSLVFFRATLTTGGLGMAESMLGLNGFDLATVTYISKPFFILTLGYFAIIFLLPNTQQFFSGFAPSLEPQHKEQLWGLEKLTWTPSWQWAIICSTMFSLALMNISRETEFIYFQF